MSGARFGVEFTGANWAVVDRKTGRPVSSFDPGARGRRAAEGRCRQLNLPGVRTIAHVSTVVRNAAYEQVATAAGIHAEWRCGEATVFVRDDLCGSVSTLVRCPGWDDDMRLPAGVSLELLAFVVEAAKASTTIQVRSA